ncbi:MAG: hypothetical protein A2Z17_01700 [Gammaproteobacteria bacterium RBG_16_66_13]|nr:MAG: hypothetical protein A2Z17_01700 [Gammaproteobacteria bacterium RBG_16_66_13]
MTTNTTAPQPLPTSFLRAAISARLAWGLILAMAALGAGVVLYASDPIPWANSDSVEYAVSARNLIRGAGLGLIQASGRFSPVTHFPPLYPLVLATSAWFGADRPDLAQEALANARAGDDGFIDPDSAAWVVSAYGLSVPAEGLARTPEEAVAVANRLGYPVAVKIASPDIPHKSDFGGVRLSVMTPSAVTEAFQQVTSAAWTARPGVEILGATIQAMAGPGQDVIIGAVQDPQFGALVMFGSGGIEVEGLGDVAFALAPLTIREAEALIDGTWAGRKLHGVRGQPPADREAVVRAVLAIGQMAIDLPQLAEVEVNPLRVHPEGKGALALDIRMRVHSEQKVNPPALREKP